MSLSSSSRKYLLKCAGKTQRKYTLLGEPGSGIAAVIVEANRFAYVYHETPPSEPYGTHQVDTEVPRLFIRATLPMSLQITQTCALGHACAPTALV